MTFSFATTGCAIDEETEAEEDTVSTTESAIEICPDIRQRAPLDQVCTFVYNPIWDPYPPHFAGCRLTKVIDCE